MDARLRTAAELFPVVNTGADIGADHGLLSCYLLRIGRAGHMWLTDLSADALSHARRNIMAQGLLGRASFSVGNGFNALSGHVEAAAVLGMGGATIAGIIGQAPPALLPPALVLSAHTQQTELRRAVYAARYRIDDERIALAGGRYYVLIRAQRDFSAQMPDERLLFLGPSLSRCVFPEYRAYIKQKLAAYKPSRSEEGRQRFTWLQEEAERAGIDSPDGI